MRGHYRPLKGVSVGGCPLDKPLQIAHVGKCTAKEARENVAERPQFATKLSEMKITDRVTFAPWARLSALASQESWVPMSTRVGATAVPLSLMN